MELDGLDELWGADPQQVLAILFGDPQEDQQQPQGSSDSAAWTRPQQPQLPVVGTFQQPKTLLAGSHECSELASTEQASGFTQEQAIGPLDRMPAVERETVPLDVLQPRQGRGRPAGSATK